MIHGNLEGIKDSILNEIESIYDCIIEKNNYISKELADKLSLYTEKLNREIAVFVNRKGKILDITIGNYSTVSLPQIETKRRGYRLCGVRCIHTHPEGSGILSSIDINSMHNLRLDSMAAIGVSNGKPANMYCALPSFDQRNSEAYLLKGPFYYQNIEAPEVVEAILEIDRKIDQDDVENIEEIRETAILVGLGKYNNKEDIHRTCLESLDELELLAETAGAIVIQKVLQYRSTSDAAYYIGRGKAEEICLLKQDKNANLIIFDDELSGAQIRNLENIIGAKVIDRTALILDIFAKHAKSRTGKIQVELAQMKYRLPRLIGLGMQLSRLGGGIGTRGPGEKKLEVDRRHINRRILFLENQLHEIKKQRNLQRNKRSKNEVPTIALVGYTNAGKSTLMNALSDADVLVEDKLFATLDPTVRKITLDTGQEFLLVDTVGFIRKLPHHLVEAFKSTLEETLYADILLHVIDSSCSEYKIQEEVTLDILKKLGVSDKPIITVYNKTDLTDITFDSNGTGIKISAKNGAGLDKLIEEIKSKLPEEYIQFEGVIPYANGNILNKIHENGVNISEEYIENGIRIKTSSSIAFYNSIKKYLITE